MTLINLRGLELKLGGYGPLDSAEGTITYVDAQGIAVRAVGDSIRFAGPINFKITAGNPNAAIELPPTPLGVAALWSVRKGTQEYRALTLIPESGQVDIGSLVEVDRKTLFPLTPSANAWELFTASMVKNAANGVAGLGPDSKIADAQMPARLDDAALNNKVVSVGSESFASQRRSRAQRAIGFGDSIMQASDGVVSGYGGSWFSKLTELSGQRLQRVRNAGVAGNSTAAMLARLNADVLTQRGDIVVVEAITPNDDPATVTLAQQQRNVRSIIEQCLYRNKRVVVCGGPPNNNPAIASRMREMTTWARALVAQMGLDFIDLFTPVGDPATGAWLPGFTADGVHPNAAGQDAIATYNAARIPDDLRPAPVLANLGDSTNLLTGNGLFEVDTNADGYADGWTNSGLAAGSLIPRADGVGNWQSITGDQSTDYLQQAGITGWNVGDTLAVSGEWVNIDGSGVNVELRFTGGTPYSTSRAISARAEVGGPRTFYMEIAVPASTTAVNLRLWPSIGTARFGRIKVANLTTLGLL